MVRILKGRTFVEDWKMRLRESEGVASEQVAELRTLVSAIAADVAVIRQRLEVTESVNTIDDERRG